MPETGEGIGMDDKNLKYRCFEFDLFKVMFHENKCFINKYYNYYLRFLRVEILVLRGTRSLLAEISGIILLLSWAPLSRPWLDELAWLWLLVSFWR